MEEKIEKIKSIKTEAEVEAFNKKVLELLNTIKQKVIFNHDKVAGYERTTALTEKGRIRIHNDSNSIFIEKDIGGKTEKILTEHKKAFIALAKKLVEVETLEQEEYEKIIIAHGIMPKTKTEPELSSSDH